MKGRYNTAAIAAMHYTPRRFFLPTPGAFNVYLINQEAPLSFFLRFNFRILCETDSSACEQPQLDLASLFS